MSEDFIEIPLMTKRGESPQIIRISHRHANLIEGTGSLSEAMLQSVAVGVMDFEEMMARMIVVYTRMSMINPELAKAIYEAHNVTHDSETLEHSEKLLDSIIEQIDNFASVTSNDQNN